MIKNFDKKTVNFENYDSKRHIYLLKRYYDSKMKLREDSKSALSNEEESELMSYDIYLEKQTSWRMRDWFESLFQDFFNQKIDNEEFIDRVFGLRRTLLNETIRFQSDLVLGRLETFRGEPNAKNLSKLLSYLYYTCDTWEDFEDRTEEEFAEFVEKGFLMYQEILNS